MPFARSPGFLGPTLAALAPRSKNTTTGPNNPGGGVQFTLTPCGGAYTPIVKVGMQDGTGAWTAVNQVGGSYSGSFQAAKGGLLIVYGGGGSYSVDVVYGLPTELANYVTSGCTQPIGNANVTVNSLQAGETATVGM